LFFKYASYAKAFVKDFKGKEVKRKKHKKERTRKQEERNNMQVHALHHTPSSCFLTFLSF